MGSCYETIFLVLHLNNILNAFTIQPVLLLALLRFCSRACPCSCLLLLLLILLLLFFFFIIVSFYFFIKLNILNISNFWSWFSSWNLCVLFIIEPLKYLYEIDICLHADKFSLTFPHTFSCFPYCFVYILTLSLLLFLGQLGLHSIPWLYFIKKLTL